MEAKILFQLLCSFLLIELVSRTQMISLQDVQKMKEDLNEELHSMEKTAEVKKAVKKDSPYDVVLSDLIQHDIQGSLKHFTKDSGTEEAAMRLMRKMVDEDQSGYVNDDDKKLDQLIIKDKQKNLLVDKKEALEALEKLRIKDLERRLNDAQNFKRRVIVNSVEATLQEEDCKDERQDCYNLAQYCAKDEYKQTMQVRCRYTCKFCHRCEDVLTKVMCRRLAKQCRVPLFVQRMREYCYSTCGYCKSKSPPACQTSPFGCCWNNATKKEDKKGTNCPICADKYETLCTRFRDQCAKDNRPGKFMRKNCPKKCGLCRECETNVDKPGFKELCMKWKKEGYCSILDIGVEYCAHTCHCQKI